VSHDDPQTEILVQFEGEPGPVSEAEVQLIESSLGELIQAILSQEEAG
jgi:hypothetical protein